MRKPQTDESNVQMSDVICDFCHREWTESRPMVEGHQGSCICGDCLRIAYVELVLTPASEQPLGAKCVLCLEDAADRAALGRGAEPGWTSPHFDASVCRRCLKQSAGVLHTDPDINWRKPTTPGTGG